MLPGYQLLCWDCKEPIEEPSSEQVKIYPHLAEWMTSNTRVCVDCALRRMVEEE